MGIPDGCSAASHCMTTGRCSCLSLPTEMLRRRQRSNTQKAMLRERYRNGKWECQRILDELDRSNELYFDRVSQIRMPNWSQGRVALAGDAAFCVSLLAGQGSALAMISAYVLAGELAAAGGRHQEAFGSMKRACGPISTPNSGAPSVSPAPSRRKRDGGLDFAISLSGRSPFPGWRSLPSATISPTACSFPAIVGPHSPGWRRRLASANSLPADRNPAAALPAAESRS